jgi:SapC
VTKQLLIYDSAVPVAASRHGSHSIERSPDYSYSAHINAVPLMAVEFIRAATEYAIVFAESGSEILPAAVLGIRPNENLYVNAEAKWEAKYIPAFIRRYPFVFSIGANRQTVTLCIDESYPGLNREGRGNRLFTDGGNPSVYTEQVLKFLKEYQAHYERTRSFGRRLKELDLLEPMQAQLTTQKGEKFSLGGFMAIPRKKLRALSSEALTALAKTDELELAYLHLYSLRNFTDVKDRFVDLLAEATAAT